MSSPAGKLIAAVTSGDSATVLKLLKQGIDCNAVNEKNQSVLQLAANRNLIEPVGELLDRGAAVDSRDDWGQTPLMRAAFNRHHEIMEMLIDRGADVNARNAYNKSVLHYAAEGGARRTVEFLLERGADIDAVDDEGATVLMIVAAGDKERPRLCKKILEICGNRNERDRQGKNAMDYAMESGNKKIIAMLKKAGLEKTDTATQERIQERNRVRLIKKVSCPTCGAPKDRPYSSPYIYCDYCASFIDWDQQLYAKIVENNRAEAVAYAEKAASFGGDMEKALRKGDARAYGEVSARLTEAHMAALPECYSPRIADAKYRKALLNHIRKAGETVIADAKLRASCLEQLRRQGNILWSGQTADSIGFQKYFSVLEQFIRDSARLLEERKVFRDHPDGLDGDTYIRMMLATQVQGWLPYLSKVDVQRVLEVCGGGDYREAPALNLEHRRCGGCGGELDVARGAREVICDNCGRIIDVSCDEFFCPSCGQPCSFPRELTHLECPACQGRISRIESAE